MTDPLEILKKNRSALLLAEIAAWLHDCQKCTEQFVESQSNNSTKKSIDLTQILAEEVINRLKECKVSLNGEQCSIWDLIQKGIPRNIKTDKSFLIRYLGKCHAIAHADKELENNDPGKQKKEDTRPSNAFGHESEPLQGLTERLNGLPFERIDQEIRLEAYRNFVAAVREAFSAALADTRRPINEVTLEDWSAIVAALYKSALAGKLLGEPTEDPDDLRWKILSVNLDVLGLYSKAIKVSDLLGYQTTVETAFEKIRALIEGEYPLGNELYRDVTGIYFTFPNIELPQQLEQIIRQRIAEVDQDLIPQIGLTPMPPPSEPKGRDYQKEALKTMLRCARRKARQELASPFTTETIPAQLQDIWQQPNDLCPVCQMRPQDKKWKICSNCANRRQERLKKWLCNQNSTIWNNEVADSHGRLALLVGQFNLDDWLDGDMISTLLLKSQTSKSSAPARLRRIWRTTERFWQEVNDHQIPQTVGHRTARLKIQGAFEPEQANLTLSQGTYQLIAKGIPINAVWSEKEKLFIICDQLEYLSSEVQFNQPLKNVLHQQNLEVRSSSGYGNPSRVVGKFQVKMILEDLLQYLPVTNILQSPITWMVLVPADKALKLLSTIEQKYQKEMNKVRNRLALTLGIVYFSQETPLSAGIEAGRRMLARPARAISVTVQATETISDTKTRVTLNANGRTIPVEVETKMGDGETSDTWYVCWKINSPLNDRSTCKPSDTGDNHWINFCAVAEDDQVEFIPSTFDYEWLDTTGRRMEIAYHQGSGDPPGWSSRRMRAQAHRPYYLEELRELEEIAKHFELSSYSKSQLYAVRDLIEAKRQLWQKPSGYEALNLPKEDVFRCFIQDVLQEAGLYNESLQRAALSGMFCDAIELYQMLASQTSAGGAHV